MALKKLLPVETPKAKTDVSLAIVNIVLLLIFFLEQSQHLSTLPFEPQLDQDHHHHHTT